MDILLQWIGTVALLLLLFVLVPVVFMLIVTLQFRLSGGESGTKSGQHPEASAGEPRGTTPPSV